MMFVGIDPGLTGGIGWTDGEESGTIKMPIIDGRPDLSVLSGLLLDKKPKYVVIETPSVRPGESGTSALTIGINWGMIAGLLAERGIPWSEARPEVWKKRLGIPAPAKKVKGTEETEEQTKARLAAAKKQKKETSIGFALRLFPSVDFKASERSTTYSDGMCEALLIAEYARREWESKR